MNTKGRVVLLNGVGSSGKTSIAMALQTMTAAPLLYVAMDTFIDMLPERLQDHPDTFAYKSGESGISIATGPAGKRLLRGMRRAVATMAAEGNDLIVDDVILGDGMADYERLLAGFRFHRVGVFCPLDLLENRERARGDRLIGLARWQFDRVHAGKHYDTTVDTGENTPAECARLIVDRLGL